MTITSFWLGLFLVTSIASTTPVIAPQKPVSGVLDPPAVATSTLISKWAEFYGTDSDKMTALMNCESGGNAKAWNQSDPNGGSFGLFQYQTATFNLWSKELGITDDIYDVEAQIRLTAYALSKGRGNHWTCYRRLIE